MRKAIIGALTCLLGAVIALAGQRAANALKSTRLTTDSVLVSCQDEREPVVTEIKETKTAIIVSCKVR